MKSRLGTEGGCVDIPFTGEGGKERIILFAKGGNWGQRCLLKEHLEYSHDILYRTQGVRGGHDSGGALSRGRGTDREVTSGWRQRS